MMTVVSTTAEYTGREYVREREDLAIGSAPGSKDVYACAQAVVPVQSETFQPIMVPTTVRIRLDAESLTKQARNEDEELAIIAAINRFYIMALLGATDGRCTC